MSSSVNFTIRRPTPALSRTSSGPESDSGSSSFKAPFPPKRFNEPTPLGSPLGRSAASTPGAGHDSSDEDSAVEEELVTGFDKFGVQRLNGERKVEKPLVIPALKNKDWRAVARKRRGQQPLPPPAAQTGADGSVGGLGTTETIGTEPVLAGLYVVQRESVETSTPESTTVVEEGEAARMEIETEENEEQRALRAILAEVGATGSDSRTIDVITPMSEADALKQDVDELPEAATLEDYERVPVSQFGAALLRGMGWKEGTAASRKPGKGPIEPYIPATRPALLGLGAKEQEVLDDGTQKRRGGKATLLVKPIIPRSLRDAEEKSSRNSKERSRSPRRSHQSSSRRGSRSPDRYSSRNSKSDDRRRQNDYGDRDRDRRRREEDRTERYGDDRKRRGDDEREARDRADKSRRKERSRERDRDSRRK